MLKIVIVIPKTYIDLCFGFERFSLIFFRDFLYNALNILYLKKNVRIFLKYILNQNSESLLSRFLQIQIEKPTKFDWVSTCFKDLKKLKLDISFEDIKNLPNNQFKNMIRKKCKKVANENDISKGICNQTENMNTHIRMQSFK